MKLNYYPETDSLYIDLGPEGGDQGGFVVTEGNPLDIIKHPNGSHTARYLKQYLDN